MVLTNKTHSKQSMNYFRVSPLYTPAQTIKPSTKIAIGGDMANNIANNMISSMAGI